MGGCCTAAIEMQYRDKVMDMRRRPDRAAVEIRFRSGRVMMIDEWAIQDLCREHKYRGRRYEYQVSPMRMSPGDIYQLPPDYQDVLSYKAMWDYGVQVAPRPRCSKCGEEHDSKLDHHGFCQKQATNFWAKVRRLYWHRYSKEQLT